MTGKLPLLAALTLALNAPVWAQDTAAAWPPVGEQTKPWTRWWWPGDEVNATDLQRALQRYAAAGLGGVEITPIYGVKGHDAEAIAYLSPAWVNLLHSTVTTAKALHLGVDMAMNTGWCFGGPTVSKDRDANAFVTTATYPVAAGGKLDAVFDKSIQSVMAYSDDGKQVDLTSKISADGRVDWSPTGGNWKVIAVGQKFSGQMVKRPAPGDEGPMLNPLYPDAMRRYTEWFGTAFSQNPGPLPEAMFQDSYEYQSNWAPDFLAQFQKFRGWPLQSQFPALFSAGTDDQTARVKHDYQETVSDLLVTETIPAWVDWCHAHGFKVRYQAHGSPGNLIDLYALADVPETEGIFGRPNPLVAQFASSAAHLTGKPLASAETATWLDEHFHVTLAEIKATAEDFYLAGINHVVFHGTCYSPDDAAWPGWLFYAATDLNPRMALWHNFPTLAAYLTRCQSILQSGQPDHEVLLYWPVAELWSDPKADPKLVQQLQVEGGKRWLDAQPTGKAAALLKKRGYTFDYISDRLLQGAAVLNGKIVLKGGTYSAIVVPDCKLMPVETLAGLLHIADAGGTVIFENHLPSDVPGLSNLEEHRADLKHILAQFPAGQPKPGNPHLLVGGIEDSLKAAGITRETFGDQSDLQFVRRRAADGYYYYLVNHGKDAVDGWFSLERPAASVVIMDAMSGTTGQATTRQADGKAQVYLHFAPGQSLFLHALTQPAKAPAWAYWTPQGQPVPLPGKWQISFVSGGPELPKPFSMDQAAFWTTSSDPATQAFSGTASYTVDFDRPATAAKAWRLSLGEVQESARVILNGQPVGTLIAAPYEIMLPPTLLKPTGNHLVVEVTSSDANRIRDLDQRKVDWKIFKDTNFVTIKYKHFDASKWSLQDSGLAGPVSLTPCDLAATLP